MRIRRLSPTWDMKSRALVVNHNSQHSRGLDWFYIIIILFCSTHSISSFAMLKFTYCFSFHPFIFHFELIRRWITSFQFTWWTEIISLHFSFDEVVVPISFRFEFVHSFENGKYLLIYLLLFSDKTNPTGYLKKRGIEYRRKKNKNKNRCQLDVGEWEPKKIHNWTIMCGVFV